MNLLDKIAGDLKPYTPGEQDVSEDYIKLNTNENPYPTSKKIIDVLNSFDRSKLSRYPDPSYRSLREAISKVYSVNEDSIFIGSGSDEVLLYAFKAFANIGKKVYFPDITYDFYKLYSDLNNLNEIEIPLDNDFKINIDDYKNLDGSIIIPNPNAPSGYSITINEIEDILKSNVDNLVVIDEAYIDFSPANSAIELINDYKNLLIVQTCSKSRSLAGLRLGFGFANIELIERFNRLKDSVNPYNINSLTLEIAEAIISDREYFHEITNKIINTRDRFIVELRDLNFTVLDSEGNFVLAKHNEIGGEVLFKKLEEKGILVRYFPKERIKDYIRISIGTDEEMDIFLEKIKLIIKEG